MTVREVLQRTDSAELTEWLAYDQLEPFGDARADLRAGLICSTVANFSMSPPKSPVRPSDFMLFEKAARDDAPVLLADPKSHSSLIRQAIFGVRDS